MAINKKIKIVDIRQLPVSIPIDVLQDRTLSSLEAIVVFLRDKESLTYSEIAKLLKRDDRTIWTTYKRAHLKLKEVAS